MLTTSTSLVQLGRLKFGTKHTFDYLITNNYQTAVHIDRIIAGCHSCTTTSIDKTVLQPGETGILTVKFTPGSLGIQTKGIKIHAFIGGALLPPLEVKFKSNVHE